MTADGKAQNPYASFASEAKVAPLAQIDRLAETWPEVRALNTHLNRLPDRLVDHFAAAGQPVQLRAFLLDSTAANARVRRIDGATYAVGINLGLTVRISMLARILLSIDLGRGSFGGPSRLADAGYFSRLTTADGLEDWDNLIAAERTITERDGACTSGAAEMIAMLATEWVLLHELHHIVLGHSTIAAQQLGIFTLEEAPSLVVEAKHFELRQGIEAAADFEAGYWFGQWAPERVGPVIDYSRLHVEPGLHIRSFSYAVGLLMCLPAFATSPLDASHHRSSHPHPQLRYLMAMEGLLRGLANRDSTIVPLWRQNVAPAFFSLTEGFKNLGLLQGVLWSLTSNLIAVHDELWPSAEVAGYYRLLRQQVSSTCERTRHVKLAVLGGSKPSLFPADSSSPW